MRKQIKSALKYEQTDQISLKRCEYRSNQLKKMRKQIKSA